MVRQLELDLSRRDNRVVAGPRLAARMIAVLAARRTWTTRAQFAEHGLSDRQCRLGRAASHGRILRGQRGYLLLRHATPDDIRECLAAWQAQIEAEQREHALLCRRAHGLLHNKSVA